MNDEGSWNPADPTSDAKPGAGASDGKPKKTGSLSQGTLQVLPDVDQRSTLVRGGHLDHARTPCAAHRRPAPQTASSGWTGFHLHERLVALHESTWTLAVWHGNGRVLPHGGTVPLAKGERKNIAIAMILCIPITALAQSPIVDPPLAGRPPDFSNIVGKYQIRASAAPTEVAVEQPILLRVLVIGEGPPKYEPRCASTYFARILGQAILH